MINKNLKNIKAILKEMEENIIYFEIKAKSKFELLEDLENENYIIELIIIDIKAKIYKDLEAAENDK